MHRESEDYSLETIAKWEEGLKQVAEIWGPRSKDYSRKEDLVSALVADVVRRVKSVDMEVAKYPVAIDHRVNELHAIINNHESLDGACIVGIVGMTGIGKPTIAKRYFNLHRSSFRSSCFVGNIKQMTGEELQNTQKLLLKELALYNADHISSTDQGIKLLKKHLQGPKFLLILDDVDDHLQLKALMVHEVLSHESIILGFMNVEYLSLVERRSNPSKMAKLNMVPSSIIWKEDGMSLLKAWPVQFFTKMSKLKLLFLEDTCIEGEFNILSKGIIWLRWQFCPYVTLPKGLPLSNCEFSS
ncbi:disease resistance protein ADR2 [Amborella trichopoda]|uniref:disease resistance protein ADR2 n=1 Tax=Amborella trichopoda TaxID=13333 RepID=UPI0009C11AFA|nr:disease resistance protein ADR2 [Amborella trichopoda]|eukprot:XP_020531017.1 disease resistance protein ADR2 [Amborella trichopoda]